MTWWRRFRAWLSRLFRRRPPEMPAWVACANAERLAKARQRAVLAEQLERLVNDQRWGGESASPTFDEPLALRRERRPGQRTLRGLRR